MVEVNKVYQHYKGNYYHVISRATHTETNEELVIYFKLEYKEDDFWAHSGTPWARPAAMFEETVEVNGQTVPRFQQVGKLVIPEQ